jgi:glutamine synthetase
MCPTINSYKRLLGGEVSLCRPECREKAEPQAMWAPDTASYGYDSRAASIRILSAPGVGLPATRFEVRVPGADVRRLSSSLSLNPSPQADR